MNLCSKPRCARPGSVLLAYDYSGRRALLVDPGPGEQSPHVYALCSPCAERLTPPRGWTLEDRREEPPLFLAEEKRATWPTQTHESGTEPARSGGRQLFFGGS